MKYTGVALALASTAFGQSLVEVLSGAPELSQLVGLLNQTGAASALANATNITLLAPNNDAITEFTSNPDAAALLGDTGLVAAILNYHVIQGNYSTINETSFLPTLVEEGAYANVTGGQVVEALVGGDNITFFSGLLSNSSVVNASIPFSGGTIHIIDRLLTLPASVSETAQALNLTSAVGALQALELTETADTTPDVTIFLPDNAAFQRIGGNLANLSTEELTNILAYHVVAGTVLYSTDAIAANGTNVTTSSGANLTVNVEDDGLYINNAKVILPNVLVANGVVHVIDRVLNPANSTVEPDASTTVDAFDGAASATEAPFTSGIDAPTSALNTAQATSAQASASSAASSAGGAARAMETGALAFAAIFGGAAAALNM